MYSMNQMARVRICQKSLLKTERLHPVFKESILVKAKFAYLNHLQMSSMELFIISIKINQQIFDKATKSRMSKLNRYNQIDLFHPDITKIRDSYRYKKLNQ